MKVKAAVFMGENKNFEVREFEVTKPPKGYAQMELLASGICGTDIHIHNGKLPSAAPAIIGHEFVGRITDVNSEEAAQYGLKLGDAVIADIAVPCGKCVLCKNGDDANCVNMQLTNSGSIDIPPYLYGGYTEMNYTPLANLIKIPEELDPILAATFACPGPTVIHACCLAEKAGVELRNINTAVVQGLGPVGIFAVMYLKKMGIKKVYAITRGSHIKREELTLLSGADQIFNLSKEGAESITALLKKENEGLGVDLCLEASGAPNAFVQGMDILRNRGVYLVPGQYSNSGSIEIQPQMITFKALHIIGSSQYSVCDVKKYLEFLKNNKDLHPIISQLANKYNISQINEAIADAKDRNNIKTLLIQ